MINPANFFSRGVEFPQKSDEKKNFRNFFQNFSLECFKVQILTVIVILIFLYPNIIVFGRFLAAQTKAKIEFYKMGIFEKKLRRLGT